MAVLLVFAMLLPLGLAAYEDIRESRRQLFAATETLLVARAEQLVGEVDTVHAGYQRAVAVLARLPRIVSFCEAGGPAADAFADLDIQRAADPNVRGVAILDRAGIVQLATETQLVGKDLSGVAHVAEALRGNPVISDIHVAGPEVGATPTIAYLQPVRGAAGSVVVIWARAALLWATVKASNDLAGPRSFAVLFDRNGIRLAHTIDQGMVFHPAAPLDPAFVDALAAERRFGENTRALLEDVRSFREGFARAREGTVDPVVYRGLSPRTHKWNYGVARRLQTVHWTFCFNVPEETIQKQIAALTGQKLVFAGTIMVAAILLAMLFASFIVDPVRRLTLATEGLGKGDLKARVSVARTDELGRLGESFNAMANRIEQQADALAKSRDGLEREVSARTAELREEAVERRRVEEDLRITLASIGDAVIATDVTGKIARMNPVAERLTGWTIEEARGRHLDTVFEIVNEDTRKVVESPVDHVIREGVVVGLANHTVLIAKDGTERAIADSGAPIRDAEGALCGVVLVFHDQSVERIAERALERSEARKAAVMEAALDAIVLMDHDGKISDFNPAAERTFGHMRHEVIGKLLADVLVPSELRDRHRSGLARYLTSGVETILGRRVEVTALRKNGQSFPAEVAVVRIRSDGPPVFTGYIRDITERRQAAEAALLRREKEVAETANRELEAFSYSVAHDLRAPLRGICGFSSVLLEDYGEVLDTTAKAHLRRIIGAGDRMGQIIDTLLSLARLSRADVRREHVDLTELARSVMDEVRAAEPGRAVDLVVAEGLTTRADPHLLRTVLENLLGNAFKFTRNEPRAQIEIGVTSVGGTLHYFVRDNGAGFDMAHTSQLFAPFQRLHSAEEFEGSGVGLATVQRIIVRHGGRVWAESVQKLGATFSFTLVEEPST